MPYYPQDVDNFDQYAQGLHQLDPEMQLQIAWMRWMERKHPTIRERVCASAGGLWTSKKNASLMKSSGYKKGWPDATFVIPQRGYHGMYIEVKTKVGRPTPEQLDVVTMLNEMGYYAVIQKGWTALCETVEWYCEEWIHDHPLENLTIDDFFGAEPPMQQFSVHGKLTTQRYRDRIARCTQAGIAAQYAKRTKKKYVR